MSGDGELSDDPNIVVIPVEDSKSDGLKSTWPRNGADSRWVYSIRDDVGWRLGLAQMWVEKQMGAPEEGAWQFFVVHSVFFCLGLLANGLNLPYPSWVCSSRAENVDAFWLQGI